jgi:predicted PurR-regulated permease PerM
LWWVAGVVLAGVWAVLRLRTLATLLLVSWFLAYVFHPIVTRLERRRIPRWVGVILILTVVAGCTAAAVILVVPALSEQVRSVAEAFPGYVQAAQQNLSPRLEAWLGRPLPTDAAEALGEAARALQGSLPTVARGAAQVAAQVFANTWSFIQVFLSLLLIPVFAFYVLLDFDGLSGRVVRLVPVYIQPVVRRLLERSDEVLGAFIRGQLGVCATLALVYSMGLTFTGIDMPWVVGLLSGALFVIPYLGTLVGILLGSLLALLKFHDFVHVAAVWTVFAVGQGLEGFLLTPKFVGHRVGLHPLAVILAVIAGGELFGFVGVLLAVPGAAVLRVGLAQAMEAYIESDFYRGEGP